MMADEARESTRIRGGKFFGVLYQRVGVDERRRSLSNESFVRISGKLRSFRHRLEVGESSDSAGMDGLGVPSEGGRSPLEALLYPAFSIQTAGLCAFDWECFKLPYNAGALYVRLFRAVVRRMCGRGRRSRAGKEQNEALSELWRLIREFLQTVFALEDEILFAVVDVNSLQGQERMKAAQAHQAILARRAIVSREFDEISEAVDSLFLLSLSKLGRRLVMTSQQLELVYASYIVEVLKFYPPMILRSSGKDFLVLLRMWTLRFFWASDLPRHQTAMLLSWMTLSDSTALQKKFLDQSSKATLRKVMQHLRCDLERILVTTGSLDLLEHMKSL
uniref:Uncharacterized protein n=1 Tax=Compsopogon caeruleus TaxID=31354 RepID=A0A7S1TBX6_9RHOD|mmetsp:Transcript_15821/g.31754  ORF Transcript_15821/g.31754 Transcript_15821/m.31754 type:complete len:333 (+) Transcript_15821:97-1095(+)